MTADFLKVHRGQAPVIIAFPHTGTYIPAGIEARLTSPWLARKDADWWIDRLYDFADELDVTTVRTAISRTVIDVNRDPSGVSLYPGQATTELCPTTSFDGEPLYREKQAPDADEIEARKQAWFDPYHAALVAEITRLRALHPQVVLYDAHSIRSNIPRLFQGRLPQFNIGTNGGVTCAPALSIAASQVCDQSGMNFVLNGRFKGGWTTRHYGRPFEGVHALQMELACRGYMDEPAEVAPDNWPTPYDPARADTLKQVLRSVIGAAIGFANS